ncbi:hypothetical protein H4R33_005182 [Dimargaris cristalligena]|nr:hypothetical protein H4R33_005182 [Dimargaris cristalligena]
MPRLPAFVFDLVGYAYHGGTSTNPTGAHAVWVTPAHNTPLQLVIDQQAPALTVQTPPGPHQLVYEHLSLGYMHVKLSKLKALVKPACITFRYCPKALQQPPTPLTPAGSDDWLTEAAASQPAMKPRPLGPAAWAEGNPKHPAYHFRIQLAPPSSQEKQAQCVAALERFMVCKLASRGSGPRHLFMIPPTPSPSKPDLAQRTLETPLPSSPSAAASTHSTPAHARIEELLQLDDNEWGRILDQVLQHPQFSVLLRRIHRVNQCFD